MYSFVSHALVAVAPAVSSVAASAQEEGLTLSEVVDSLPTDPASLFTVGLMVVFFGMVLWVGRGGPKGRGGTPLAPS